MVGSETGRRGAGAAVRSHGDVLPNDPVSRTAGQVRSPEADPGVADRLLVTIEEMEAANRGLMASNEALQSAIAELEVSQAELQAVNEELRSVNAELARRVADLARANADLKTLMESAPIASQAGEHPDSSR